MKLLFSFVFLLFSSLSFQSQALVLVEGPPSEFDFNQFNWEEFNNQAEEYINIKNKIVNEIGFDFIIPRINLDKLDLMRIEQELGLYKMGVKEGLSAEMIQAAAEAIALHWENVNSIENQIKARAGLAGGVVDVITAPIVGEAKDYYNGVWELHKGDHEIVFNMVEKKDEALYKAFGGDDEAYVGFIAPYVERYMQKMGQTAQAYYDSFKSAGVDVDTRTSDAYNLFNMYLNSAEIYNCFIKNFKSPVGEKQRMLMGSIYDWHTNQSLLGANSTIEAYKTYGIETRPNAVAYSLFKFYNAPIEVKEQIGTFLRENILNNEEFINSRERLILKARVNALIGLNYLGVATPAEQDLYDKAIEQGIIEHHSTHSFSGHPAPLPE